MTTEAQKPVPQSPQPPQPRQPTPAAQVPQPVGVIREVVDKDTKDLYLAAAFHCEGCKYIKIDKTDRTRMVFWFEGGELADRVEREWYQATLVVSATAYASSLRHMKSLIHS